MLKINIKLDSLKERKQGLKILNINKDYHCQGKYLSTPESFNNTIYYQSFCLQNKLCENTTHTHKFGKLSCWQKIGFKR